MYIILYEIPKISVIQSDIHGSRESNTEHRCAGTSSQPRFELTPYGQISGTISKMALKGASTSVLHIRFSAAANISFYPFLLCNRRSYWL